MDTAWTHPCFAPKEISAADIREFVEKGFLLLRGVFSAKLAAQIVPLVWKEMAEAAEEPTTWTQPIRIVKKVLDDLPIDEILTPRYRASLNDLCGSGKWETNLGVGYWVNLFPEVLSPSRRPQAIDWHIDIKTDASNHNSPDLGLTVMEYFTDIDPGGGGTALRVGSHRTIARLAAAAEFRLSADELSERAFGPTAHLPEVQVTARAGDVLLIHPFTLHASSSNITQRVRIAANRPISLFEPRNFDRKGTHSWSPVEWAVVSSLDQPKEQERAVR